VQFADLGLVVVDEQHRFGVEQRDALRSRGERPPHMLVMTATPIPRTVAMTVFGDLETSVLSERPAGRAATVTHVVPADNPVWMARTWVRVREEVDKGGRAYVVCARIDPSEAPDAVDDSDGDDTLPLEETKERPPLAAATEVAAMLAERPELAGVSIGLMHGRLGADDKDAAMARFAAGDAPVLVSTTVIEVGVDVQEATAMVILDADRFGISQLHQLRGRVGRGTAPGVCLLVTSVEEGTIAHERLAALVASSDGFELAEKDLELRREGDVLGAGQSGRSSLRLLRVVRDAAVISSARDDAREVIAEDPTLERHPALASAIRGWLGEEQEEFLERA